MTAKMPSAKLSKGSTMHAAGIYADMTVDGPEIGTLVVIVDRAKNLPNRKSMGKQDPYCNCRLAKEAKKTKTDKRGGQVPRWDEELRFTVRDSPDYYQLKVSIFNDDKKTELIGESWVDLSVDGGNGVIKPGGGQSDIWHNLNCKGKYAGEVRLEMTYYDSRPKPKPEKTAEDINIAETRDVSGGPRQTPVKRRPLPDGPGSAQSSPAEHARAGGPREIGSSARPLPQPAGASRGNTPSRKTLQNHHQPQPVHPPPANQYPETPDDIFGGNQNYAQPQQSDPYDQYVGHDPYSHLQQHQHQHQEYEHRDDPMTGLPELPPMTNHRRQGSNRPQLQEQHKNGYDHATPPRQPPGLHHSHSAPQVPVSSAPYPEDMMHPRDTFQHTQSDQYMNQDRPVSRHEYQDPYQRPHDDYSPHPPEPERRSSYSYPGQPQYSPQQLPMHEGYNHIPQDSSYRQPSQQYETPSSSHYQLDAPPPPPAHRDSTPTTTRPDSYSTFAPAPLNITPIRRSPSPLPSLEQDPYSSLQQTPDHYGRRNTAPQHNSPQEHHVYRPRARSGDAMRDSYSERPRSRDSRNEDPYVLPPSHPDYHSPTTYHAPEFPTNRRDSYQPPHQPTTRSPLAVESADLLRRRDDRSSLPSQSLQSTSPRGSDLYSQPLPARTMPSPNRPYSNHSYSSSEPYVPQATPQHSSRFETPPRQQHPLSQQVGSSPTSYARPTPPQEGGGHVPLVKPVAVSPLSSLPNTPGSSADPRLSRPIAQRSTPTTRKSVSPRPSVGSTTNTSNVFDTPDSFARFNPAALSSTSSLINHPATSSHGSTPNTTPAGKIVDFHGNEIDPSDRLPETSWAPEPEPKGEKREYGKSERAMQGERVRGGRDLNVTMVSKAGSPVVARGNEGVNPAHASGPTAGVGAGGGGVIRARLRKKERPSSALVTGTGGGNERPFTDIPSPVDQFSSASRDYGFGGVAAAAAAGGGHRNSYAAPNQSQSYEQQPSSSPIYTSLEAASNRFHNYGTSSYAGFGPESGFGSGGGNAPPIPAKVPLPGMGTGMGMNGAGSGYAVRGSDEALARELRGIDLGPTGMSNGGQRLGRGRMIGY